MKRLFLAFAFLASIASAQTSQCSFTFRFTQATGFASQPAPTAFDNRQKGCNFFTVVYQAVGLSAVNVQLNSATGAATQGAFGAFSGSTQTGTNPLTNTTGGQATFAGFVAWLQIQVTGTASAATWTITGTVYGSQSGFVVPGTAAGGCAGTSATPCVVDGPTAVGSPPTTPPILEAGSDGTNIRTILTDTSGNPGIPTTSVNLSNDLGSLTQLTVSNAAGTRVISSQVPYVYDGSTLHAIRGNATGITLTNGGNTQGDGASNTANTFNNIDGSQILHMAVYHYVFNGTTWDRAHTASLANQATSETLTVAGGQVSLGAQQVENGGRWSVVSAPASGTQASASVGAIAAVRRVVDHVCFSANSSAAVAATDALLVIRDGATGAGTIIAQFNVAQLVAAGVGIQTVPMFCTPTLNLAGTTNTAMTAEFSAGLTGEQQAVFMTGYNIQ